MALVFMLYGLISETIKVELTIDARGTVEDDIRNVFHSIRVSYDQDICISFTHIIDALFDDNLIIVVLVLMFIIIDDCVVMIIGLVWITIGILGLDLLVSISTQLETL